MTAGAEYCIVNVENFPESAIRFLRRVTALPPGTHLIVVSKGKSGIDLLSVLASAKSEVLKKVSSTVTKE